MNIGEIFRLYLYYLSNIFASLIILHKCKNQFKECIRNFDYIRLLLNGLRTVGVSNNSKYAV